MQTRSSLAPVLWSFALLSANASALDIKQADPLTLPETPPEAITAPGVGAALAPASEPLSVQTSGREETRNFYNALFYASEDVPMGWAGGSIADCQPGTTSADFRAASLLRINLLRALAGVPAGITLNETYNAKAQQAALMMSAKNDLSHTPDAAWPCLTDDGNEAAGRSNLSLGYAGPTAITFGQLADQGGNNASVGHRRWLLFPQTQEMGLGDVEGDGTDQHKPANVVWIKDSHFTDPRPATRDDFVAWPPQGFIPYTLAFPRWSFSYPKADFSAATATVARDGANVPVALEPLATGAGENTLVFKPNDPAIGDPSPAPAADIRFDVKVEGVKLDGKTLPAFNYSVTLFDPAKAGADTVLPSVLGADQPVTGKASTYGIEGTVPAADGYEWLSAGAKDYTLVHTAEDVAPLGDLQAHTSIGYSLITSNFAAQGSHSSYNLRHTQPEPQVLTLDKILLPGAQGKLNIQSRLGLASDIEVATVQYSLDDGRSWRDLYSQAGQQDLNTPVENGFTPRSLALDDFAGRPMRFRFRYDIHLPGTFVNQGSANDFGLAVGWYIDDIAFEDVQVLEPAAIASADTGPGFTFTGGATGAYVLAARGTVHSHPLEWGPAKAIRVIASGNNQAPVANAGPDQPGAKLNTLVTLNGAGSKDPDNSPGALHYVWTQVSGPATTLTGADTAQPRFTPTVAGTYVFSLTVNDTNLSGAADTVSITVPANNQAPTANAGPDKKGVAGFPITLAGGGTDPDHGPKTLTYAWRQSGGPVAVALNPVAQPRFTPTVAGTYVFNLTVNDGAQDSAADSVTVTVSPSNQAPTANAGPDQNIALGSTVTLDGSASKDPDNAPNPLKFTWQAPSGSNISLNGADTQHPSFKPSLPGRYEFLLVVDDGSQQNADKVTITVTNVAPTANAGPDQSVVEGTTVTLDGSASQDPDNGPKPLNYVWQETSGPGNAAVALTNANSTHPSFTPSLPGPYTFALMVDDGNLSSAVDSVVITVKSPNADNQAPQANAGGNIEAPANTLVTLDGGASQDPDAGPNPLSYAWGQLSGPAQATLDGANTAHPSFVPSVPGAYVFGLLVNDGNRQSEMALVTVNATQAEALRLISPKAGDSFKVKQKQAVTWQSSGLAANAKLKLSVSKNGVKWTPIATVKNTGHAQWKIAKSQAGEAVRLRLCAPASAKLSSDLRCDETDGAFRVER